MIDGNKVVRSKENCCYKGTAAKGFVDVGDYDFVLAIGDDTTDEDMFDILPETAFTIKIGDALSSARNHIKSQEEVVDFLTFISSACKPA